MTFQYILVRTCLFSKKCGYSLLTIVLSQVRVNTSNNWLDTIIFAKNMLCNILLRQLASVHTCSDNPITSDGSV